MSKTVFILRAGVSYSHSNKEFLSQYRWKEDVFKWLF